MATSTNQITAPRVDFLDQNGKISREWYMYLYNLYTITGSGSGITPVINGGTGLGTIPTNGQLLIGNGTGYTLNTLGFGAGISIANGSGAISIANTGVLSNIAGAGISVSGATGNVTITNTGVLSFAGGTTGLTPASATAGAVTLAGTLAAKNGGTGFASYAIGDLLYANTTTTLAKLADVATGNALISGGVGVAPSWGKIGLTTHVSGVLPIANGGTNSTATPTAYGVSYGTGTAYAFTAAGTTGQVLTATTGGAPTWATPATSGTVTSVGLSLPAQFTVTNSPVTSSGTLTGSWNNQTANFVLAGPTTGAAAAPTFRALVSGDIPALSYVTSVTGTAPVVSSGGLTPAISMAAANTTTNGYLTSTDWNTFNNKGSGTVTAVSVVSANGFAGTSSGGATPALTLSTTITGLLKGNGTAISAATSGTDYAPATSGTSILYGNGAGGFSNVTVGSGLSFSAGTLAATTSAPSAPVTQTADFTVAATDVWLINNKSGSTCTVTLPTPSTNSGRVLYFQNYQVRALVSASSNVVPLAGGAATTSILLASSGDSATLVSDGTNWLMTQYIPNNSLLLE
jgi:hypothetical protein